MQQYMKQNFQQRIVLLSFVFAFIQVENIRNILKSWVESVVFSPVYIQKKNISSQRTFVSIHQTKKKDVEKNQSVEYQKYWGIFLNFYRAMTDCELQYFDIRSHSNVFLQFEKNWIQILFSGEKIACAIVYARIIATI